MQPPIDDEDPREAYPSISLVMQADDEHAPILDSYQSVTRNNRER